MDCEEIGCFSLVFGTCGDDREGLMQKKPVVDELKWLESF